MARQPDPRNLSVDALRLGPSGQVLWDVPHATWFTLMGVGGGVFFLSRLLGLATHLGTWLGMPVDDLLSFLAIAVGGLVLIAHLGRPLRVLRAVLKPGTSWIARGAIADFVFLAAGGLLVLPALTVGDATPFSWLPWEPSASSRLGKTVEVVALLSAAMVIYYAGQVLADRTAIPYWRSPAIPVQFVLSSLATSLGIVMGLATLNGRPIPAGQFWLLLGFLALLLVSIVWHLRTNTDAPGKAESVEQLLHGQYRRAFLGGVVAAGTVLPMLFAVIGVVSSSARAAAGTLSLLCTLPAGFALRLITLRVGFLLELRLPLRLPPR